MKNNLWWIVHISRRFNEEKIEQEIKLTFEQGSDNLNVLTYQEWLKKLGDERPYPRLTCFYDMGKNKKPIIVIPPQ